MIETIEIGEPETPFLQFGDRVRITMSDPGSGQPIFGAIDCKVVKKQAFLYNLNSVEVVDSTQVIFMLHNSAKIFF